MLFVLSAFVTLMSGTAGSIVIAVTLVISGVVIYFLFKAEYIALELLTEIAVDTRLRLLAVAGDEYDQLNPSSSSSQNNESIESDDKLSDLEKAEVYNKAIKAYLRDDGKERCNFENSIVTKEKVILRNASNETILVMEWCDGQWLR